MKYACKAFILSVMGAGLLSCTTLDDYMLGKDNTPKPAKLEAVSPRLDLAKKWSKSLGSPQKKVAYTKMAPVIQSNYIYTANAGGEVVALEKDSGEIRWTKKLSGAILSGPAIGQGRVAVTTDNSDIIVLNQENGDQIWKVTVASEVLSKPLIKNNTLLAKTVDGNLYAFDLSNGKKRWVSHHGAPDLILKASSSPAFLGNGQIVTGYADGKLDALDLASGRLLWQRSVAYASGSSDVERLVDIDANPLVEGDKLYFAAYQGHVGALRLDNGEYVWRKPASVFKNISLAGDSLYFTDSDDVIWSLNKHNGKVNWKQDKFKARGLTEPVVKGDKLFVADKTGILHVLSIRDGHYLSRANVGAAVAVAPVVHRNHVFIQDSKGTLSQYQVG